MGLHSVNVFANFNAMTSQSAAVGTKTKILAGILAVIAITAVLFVYQRGPTKGSSPTVATLRIGTGLMAVDYAPYYVARKLGWFDEAAKARGVSVSYTVFQGPAPANEALASNAVDIVMIAEPPVIVGSAAGIDIKIAGISAILTQEILVRKDGPIHSIADLKGKKAAVVLGSSSHYGLAKSIEKAGLKKTEVEVINMFPPDAKAAFSSGVVDAWAVWPPWVEQEEIAGTGRVLPNEGHLINSLMVVRGSFTRESPALLSDCQRILQRAKKWMLENPDQAQKIVAEALNEKPDVVARAWPRHQWDAKLTQGVISDMQNKADFLIDQGIIKKKIEILTLVLPQE